MKIVNTEGLLDATSMQCNEIKTCDFHVQSCEEWGDGLWNKGGVYRYYGVYDGKHYVSTERGCYVGLSSEDFERVFSAKMTSKEVKEQLVSLLAEARDQIETYDVEDVLPKIQEHCRLQLKLLKLWKLKGLQEFLRRKTYDSL